MQTFSTFIYYSIYIYINISLFRMNNIPLFCVICVLWLCLRVADLECLAVGWINESPDWSGMIDSAFPPSYLASHATFYRRINPWYPSRCLSFLLAKERDATPKIGESFDKQVRRWAFMPLFVCTAEILPEHKVERKETKEAGKCVRCLNGSLC